MERRTRSSQRMEEERKEMERIERRKRCSKWRRTSQEGRRHSMAIIALLITISSFTSIEADERHSSAEIGIVGPDIQLKGMARKGAKERMAEGEEVVLLLGPADEEEEETDEQRRHVDYGNVSSSSMASPFADHWHYSRNPSDATHFSIGGAPAIQAHISRNSWQKYQQFRADTCRKGVEADLSEKRLNSTESAYFHWEESEFHQELRNKLLPQTRDGSFRLLVNSRLLGSLDPRLFVSRPKSLCEAKRLVNEEDERQKLIKEEKHMFEDFLINKVFSPTV